MAIPARLEISFEVRQPLVISALEKLPGQYLKSCALRQFVSAFVGAAEELFTATLAMQKERTLYNASGENLDALGRIVGEPRAPYRYSEIRWFAFDRMGQPWDSTPWWCRKAPLAEFIPASDTDYRNTILARIIANHTLVSSIPELEGLLELLVGQWISFEKIGPMKVRPIIPATISTTNLYILVTCVSTRRVDDKYVVPYPATLNLTDDVVFTPSHFFCFDRSNEQRWDSGLWSCKGRLSSLQ